MKNKYKEIINSPTFQMIAVVFVLQVLQVFNIISGEQVNKLTDVIQLFIGSIAGVRATARIGSVNTLVSSFVIDDARQAVNKKK